MFVCVCILIYTHSLYILAKLMTTCHGPEVILIFRNKDTSSRMPTAISATTWLNF